MFITPFGARGSVLIVQSSVAVPESFAGDQ